MNKKELIDAVAARTGKTKKDVDKLISETLAVISDTLKEGGEIRISDFGVFSTKIKPGGKIKAFGKEYETEEKTIVKFEQYEKFFFYGRK